MLCPLKEEALKQHLRGGTTSVASMVGASKETESATLIAIGGNATPKYKTKKESLAKVVRTR